MERIVIRVRDKNKARMLFEILKALDFVELVNITDEVDESMGTTAEQTLDFFALAGIWEGRAIDLATIRRQAWPLP